MSLFISTKPAITIATNTFINVPKVIVYNDVPIFEMVQVTALSYETHMPIYLEDGTKIATIKGTRVYADKNEGTRVQVEKKADTWVGTYEGRILFETKVEQGELFKVQAELYTPSGFMFKSSETDGVIMDSKGIQIAGMMMRGNTFGGLDNGIFYTDNGSQPVGSCGVFIELPNPKG